MKIPLNPVGDGRDGTGRFAKGNRAGRGNPFAKQLYQLRTALHERVAAGDFAEMIDKLLEMAKAGSIPAAKLLLEHLIGKPVQAVHLSGPDGEKLDGLSLADIQLAVVEALHDEPAARVKVAAKLRELHEQSTRNGGAA
jgi:hypothetical protein